MARIVWLTLAVAISAIAATISSAQTNSYISATDGFWDEARLWSLAAPPSITQSGIFITNAASVNITIDSITASEFPDTLTISNLLLTASLFATNTLYLDNTGTVALHLIDGLTVGSYPINGQALYSQLVSTNSTLIVDGALGGQFVINEGVVQIIGGSLVVTNTSLVIGDLDSASGDFIVSNGFAQLQEIICGTGDGSSGSIQVIGGTIIVNSSLGLGFSGSSEGDLEIYGGGTLVITNGSVSLGNGSYSHGSMTVTGAVLLARDVGVGTGYRSSGNFAVNGGTVTLLGGLSAGAESTDGDISLSGGCLTVTNADTNLGAYMGNGSMTVSDGRFLAHSVFVDTEYDSGGSLDITGGSVELGLHLIVGSPGSLSPAGVSLSGGRLIATNGVVEVDGGQTVPMHFGGGIGNVYPTSVTLSGGQLNCETVDLAGEGNYDGIYGSDGGMLVVTGGVATVSGGIVLGDCALNAIGYVWVNGTGQLFVTNNAGTGFIDVQHGSLVLSNGVLQVDQLVMTNTCSQFLHTGGTLLVGKVILDPNMFRIVSVTRQSNDVLVSWLMAPGATNALQATTGGSGYSTNGFTDIFVVTNNTSAGVLTNYLDVGGATNKPSRYYRARLGL